MSNERLWTVKIDKPSIEYQDKEGLNKQNKSKKETDSITEK